MVIRYQTFGRGLTDVVYFGLGLGLSFLNDRLSYSLTAMVWPKEMFPCPLFSFDCMPPTWPAPDGSHECDETCGSGGYRTLCPACRQAFEDDYRDWLDRHGLDLTQTH